MTSGARHLSRVAGHTMTVVLTLVLGMTLSIVIFLRAREWAEGNLQVEFTHRATIGAAAVQRSVQAYLEVLYGLEAFYGATQAVGRDEFRDYTRNVLGRHPGLQALAWVPRVLAVERDTYLAAARKDGLTDFQITERTPQGREMRAARRDVYYPIVYVEPQATYTALWGFNLGSEPAHLATIQKALSTTQAGASAWSPLPQQSGAQMGFLVFLPIYQSAVPARTLEERRANLRGFVVGFFDLGALVEHSFKELTLGDLDVRLADATDATSRQFLHLRLRALQAPRLAFLARQSTEVEAIRAGLYWETAFNVAGRRWTMLVHPASEMHPGPPWQAWGVLVVGLLCTALCTGLLRQWTAQH